MAVAEKQIPVIIPIFNPDNQPETSSLVMINARPKAQTNIIINEIIMMAAAPFFASGLAITAVL